MNNSKHILIIEDDNEINLMISSILENENYTVTKAFSGTEGLLHLDTNKYDMILLDLMLPGLSGEELLDKIRTNNNIPIIVISAKIDSSTKIKALKSGADDFVCKPFDIDELLARVESNLRRVNSYNNSKDTLFFNGVELDDYAKSVKVLSTPIKLTLVEYSILKLMLTYPNKVFSKANIFETVWKDQYNGDENVVNVHVSRLRSKINSVSSELDFIETIWGMGYKLKQT